MGFFEEVALEQQEQKGMRGKGSPGSQKSQCKDWRQKRFCAGGIALFSNYTVLLRIGCDLVSVGYLS